MPMETHADILSRFNLKTTMPISTFGAVAKHVPAAT